MAGGFRADRWRRAGRCGGTHRWVWDARGGDPGMRGARDLRGRVARCYERAEGPRRRRVSYRSIEPTWKKAIEKEGVS